MMTTTPPFAESITQGIPTEIPAQRPLDNRVPHAPKRNISLLTEKEWLLAIENALRYFPSEWHSQLAQEFNEELNTYGRIYMHRFRPEYEMVARAIYEYPAKTPAAAAIMLMIQNNLDPKVAKYPHELITYGGNGAVFQNWAQYLLTMRYLSEMEEDQTLVMYSGHPMGLFPSHKNAPRVVVTNGMMIPNHSSKDDWNRYNAMGVTSYGQMTAGSYMYIGPQGIVHGTTITLLNAGRKLNPGSADLKGKVFVTSGLGGMSGAQALAGVITGAVCVIAEVDEDAIHQRITDGYILEENVYTDTSALIAHIENARSKGEAIALIYNGNVVDLWQSFVENNTKVELGSDQTSLHNIDDLGYCPQGISFEEAKILLNTDKPKLMEMIRQTLRNHVEAVNIMVNRGMYFWDYGNAFLKEAGEAGSDIWENKEEGRYKYPSYVQDIMGPMCFDYGFGPFRWVCTSGEKTDLDLTDHIALDVMNTLIKDAPDSIKGQLNDNIIWIEQADKNIPIVGSKSRILYADAEGRIKIAMAFNQAIQKGEIKGPIVLGRDHHDVSGTDSPYRETSNIYDGSKFTADMAVHNFVGDAFRGATWVSLHNGGGVGWGEVINGGFGMVIDGSEQSEANIKSMLHWDVNNGIARRSWARNAEAIEAIQRAMKQEPKLRITLPQLVDEGILKSITK
jgi:urocanate hydratase